MIPNMAQRKKNWLAKRREELRLSQEDVVSRLQLQGLDIARATLSHWETERYSIPLDDPKLRQVLARILRMSIREMLQAAGYEVDDQPSTPAAKRAAFIMDQLPQDKQQLALGILEQFLASE
jgi:transcriptional regulator with XRE-family HTH domain